MIGGSDDELRWTALAFEALVERLRLAGRPVPQVVVDLRLDLRGRLPAANCTDTQSSAALAALSDPAAMPAFAPRLLDIVSVADLLGVSVRTVAGMTSSGELHAVKLRRRTMVPLGALQEFVAGLPAAGRRGGAVPVPRSDGAEGPGPRPDDEEAA